MQTVICNICIHTFEIMLKYKVESLVFHTINDMAKNIFYYITRISFITICLNGCLKYLSG